MGKTRLGISAKLDFVVVDGRGHNYSYENPLGDSRDLIGLLSKEGISIDSGTSSKVVRYPSSHIEDSVVPLDAKISMSSRDHAVVRGFTLESQASEGDPRLKIVLEYGDGSLGERIDCHLDFHGFEDNRAFLNKAERAVRQFYKPGKGTKRND